MLNDRKSKLQITEHFSEFLEALCFEPPHDGSKPLLEIPSRECKDSSGRKFKQDGFKIYSSFTENSINRPSLDGIRKKLSTIFEEKGHISISQIIDAVLVVAIFAKKTGSDRLNFLNECIENIQDTEVSHFLVLPLPSNGCEIKFSGYSLGCLEENILKSRCARAGSDYYDRYGETLKSRCALRSPEFKCHVVNFTKIGITSKLLSSTKWNILVLNYFEIISKIHLEKMWDNLLESQIYNSPFDTHIIDSVNLRNNAFKFAETISIYLFDKMGYVVPESKGLTLNQIDFKDDVALRYSNHVKQYQIDKISNSEIGRALKFCARFCDESFRFLKLGRENDAALYATICLEYIFSESRSEISANVSRRCAALTHLRLGGEYTTCFNELKDLYTARSKFVHEGLRVSHGQATRLFEYARETLRSMLVLHTNEVNRKNRFMDMWIKKLDFIAAGFEAGITIDNNTLAESGIFRN